MPGGRLTHEDRQRIAAWLADGLGYAEIGRRLGRPTSTISREVARNAAPDDYLADHAQQTAGHRARRRRAPRPSVADGRPEAGFVDQFASLLAATGLPRTTARVFVCVLTADAGGLTSADLVRRLQVSPASVSKSIGYLERMELVVVRQNPGERRERYVIDDDVWLQAWRADADAHGEIATAARRGVEIFGADTTAGARLDSMGRFFGRLSEQMSGSPLAQIVVYDALTVIAALVHVGRPLTLATLATALDWPEDRTIAALDAIQSRPSIADPLVLQAIGPKTYALAARPDRLSPAQREALKN